MKGCGRCGLLLTGLLISVTLTQAAAGDQKTRYLLYSVNAGEGFNLRRDVHMRATTLVRLLQERSGHDWVLVLPPWPRLYHWKTASSQVYEPWHKFFDLASLNEFVPSIEFDDYLERNGHVIHEVMVLQNFPGEFTTEHFGKIEEQPCLEPQHRYTSTADGHWEGRVSGRSGLVIKSHHCFSAMGQVSLILPHILEMTPSYNSVLVEHFEDLLHERFGETDYWDSRYSMVYAAHLREAGRRFMAERLGYEVPEGGRGREQAKDGGGDYLSVHLRRQDYLYAHRGVVPSLEGAASQLNTLKKEQGLKAVFLASDAPQEDKKALEKMVKGVVWYTPTDTELRNYGDGGVAIIDQWIAAHGRYFTGTTYSTFSFRIREDRQFLGFSKESTFNDLCGPDNNEHDPHSCKKPAYWKWDGVPPKIGSPSSDREEL